MKIEVGEYIQVKTKTVDDIFGIVVYRCDAVGLPNPKDSTVHNMVKFTMICGSGPSANPGREIIDSQENIEENIRKNIATKISEDQANSLKDHHGNSKIKNEYGNVTKSSTGAIEI